MFYAGTRSGDGGGEEGKMSTLEGSKHPGLGMLRTWDGMVHLIIRSFVVQVVGRHS